MKLNSHNEWDTLKEIIVGMPNARANLIFKRKLSRKEIEEAEKLAHEAFPNWLIEEIREDLNGLCDIIKEFGAKVYRPNTTNLHKIFTTPHFTASTESAYNARDLYLIVGDTVIEGPSQERARYFESQSYYDIMYHYFNEDSKWISAPKPRLEEGYMIQFFEDDKKYITLSEDEFLFEPANTVRIGKDLLYLVSRSGNELGAKWLQRVLGNDYTVHTTDEIYKSSHIDSTVLCLRPKLVMLNASRVNEGNCPSIFKNWDKIWFNDIIPYPKMVTDFHRRVRVKVYNKLLKLGVESNINGIASPWIGMNFLSLDSKTIIVDKIQTKLIDVLEKHGFNCIPISFRYSYLMGGIHCSTLDTVRDSKLEGYFD